MKKTNQALHVAVGVVKIDDDRILISKRHDHLHQGGLWEFPGGKIDTGETVQQALTRELHEELGIHVVATEPLIQIPYDYGDKHVLLDVHIVTGYQGTPAGKEGQEIKIVTTARLNAFTFPAANQGIIAAMQLPHLYLITAPYNELSDLLAHIDQAIRGGVKLIQFRAHHLSADEYQRWAMALADKCKIHNVILLLNISIQNYGRCVADGLHLTSQRLLACQSRPVAKSIWFGASVHNGQELKQAMALEADYILVSPVKETASHQHVTPIGWDGFRALALQASMPVYALGGLSRNDMDAARSAGGHGIAGISLFR